MDSVTRASQLAEDDPSAFQSLSLRHSQVIDIDKTVIPNTQAWNSINTLPAEKVDQVIRPKIIVRDQEACAHIIKCIENEKVAEELQKKWKQALALNIRTRF